jgi:very-short-patch-repair endonuclease
MSSVKLDRLERLLPYYAECVREDSQEGARNFLTDEDERFLELPFDQEWSLLERPTLTLTLDSSNFLKRLRQKGQTGALFYGYPLFVDWIPKSKSGWTGGFAIPVFLVPVEHSYNGNTLEIRLTGEAPRLNGEFLDRVSRSNEEKRALLHDLGLADVDEDAGPPSLSELARRLVALDIVPKKEAIDPESINADPFNPISSISEEGLYNRQIAVLGERTRFTVGLEYELEALAKDAHVSASAKSALSPLFSAGSPGGEALLRSSEDIVEVVALNDEQRSAVRCAFENPLTVVTGPPGTGKSQVVTTVLANAYLKGQRVLFTSRNNKAVDVVEARLNSLSRHPLVVRVGRRSGDRDLRAELSQFLNTVMSVSTTNEDREDFRLAKERSDVLAERRSQLWRDIESTRLARNAVDRYDKTVQAWSEAFDDAALQCLHAHRGAVPEMPEEALRIVDRYANPRPGLFQAIGRLLNHGTDARRLVILVAPFATKPGLFGALPPSTPRSNQDWQSWSAAVAQLKARTDLLRSLSEYRDALEKLKHAPPIEDAALELLRLDEKVWSSGAELISAYSRLLPSRLNSQTRRAVGEFRAIAERLAGDQLGGAAFAKLKREQEQLFKHITSVLPLWCVTNLSARGSLPLDAELFDLVVIDEASQCDIPSAIPILYRAKRAMIIGDPNQLRHISTLDRHRAQTIDAKYGLTLASDQPYTYLTNSLFDLATTCAGDAKVITLREHFRSHNDIIQFSNRTWYRGTLRICTDYRRLRKDTLTPEGLIWTNVTGSGKKSASGSVVNVTEAKRVADEVYDLLVRRGFPGTVGVVTPFRPQANRIRELLADRLDLSVMDRSDLIVDTAHGFQGDERDVIFFSPCISPDMPKGAKFFLSTTGNLFNVAITRARLQLHVVGDQHACSGCGIKHIEEFARYVAALSSGESIAEASNSWNDSHIGHWERPFFEALEARGIRTIPQYKINQYRLDLAYVKQGRYIDIELDGALYHKDWDGSRCREDVLRDMRLMALGWEIKRFWVYRIRDEMDACVEELAKMVNGSVAQAPKGRRMRRTSEQT